MSNFKKFFAALVYFFVSNYAIAGTTPVVPFSAIKTEIGIFQHVGPLINTPAPETAMGHVVEHEGIFLVEASNVIPVRLGISFGFRYQLSGLPDGPVAELQMRVLHPPMKGSDDKLHRMSTAETYAFGEKTKAKGDILYILNETSELLPGLWTVQLLYKGTVVLSNEFTLQ